MKRPFGFSMIMFAFFTGAAIANAALLTQVTDGRSYYDYDPGFGISIQTADQLDASELKGFSTDSGGRKQIACPVFEFQMDSGLFGAENLSCTLDIYFTQTGSDSNGSGIALNYAQGNGIVEYGDIGGTLITKVDPVQSGWQSIDVSSAVQDAANGNWDWLRLSFVPDNWSGDTIWLASSENVDHEPFIAVIPEPGTMGLAIMGVMALYFRRRRFYLSR
jgi:hypothetical protein